MYADQVLSQILHGERRKVAAQIETFLMDRTQLNALFPNAHCMVLTTFANKTGGFGFEVTFFDGRDESVTAFFDSFSNPLAVKEDEPKGPGNESMFELRIRYASLRRFNVADLIWLQKAAYNLQAFSSAAYAASTGLDEWERKGQDLQGATTPV